MKFNCVNDYIYMDSCHIPKSCAYCDFRVPNNQHYSCKLTGTYISKDVAASKKNANCPIKDIESKNALINSLIKENNSLHTKAEITTTVPCKVGDVVYKICPKCNDMHNGSCKHCAWSGCMFDGACDVGVRVYSDGSYNKNPLQIVKKQVRGSCIYDIYELWNIQYFNDAQLATNAMQEYDNIRNIVDRVERFKAYVEWQSKRKICNPLSQSKDIKDTIAFNEKDKMLAKKYKAAGYNYIVRDKDKSLYICKDKPIKHFITNSWIVNNYKRIDKRNFKQVLCINNEATRLDDIITQI